MTGRDVPTRQKTLSVAFSVIMVLSMVAMGIAGFAGSAAALEQPAVDESASSQSTYGQDVSISANPADPGAASTHTITLVANGTESGNELKNISIDYGNEFDIDSVVDQDADITINTDEGEISPSNSDISNNSGTLEITNIDGTATETLDDGEVITVDIGASDKITNAGEGEYDIDVSVGTDGDTLETTTLPLQLPGPVQVYSDQHTTDGTPNGNYTLIGDALSSSDVDGDDLVDVAEGEYRERGSSVTVDSSNVTIQGANAGTSAPGRSGAESTINPNATISSVIDVNNENVTIDGFEVTNSEPITGSNMIDGEASGPAAHNLTITNTKIVNVESNGADANAIGAVNGGSPLKDTQITHNLINNTGNGIVLNGAEDPVISENTITNSTDTGGILLDDFVPGLDGGVADYKVTDNTIRDHDGVGLQLQNPVVDDGSPVISGNTFDNAGIKLDQLSDSGSSNTISVNITDNTINGTEAGVDIDSTSNVEGGAVIDITENTFTNNDGGLNVTSASGGNGAQFNVHFNTFEGNVNGTYVDAGSFGDTLNLSFNDVVDNEANGLAVNSIGGGSVNANYSWWDNRDSSRIVGPYTPQNAGSQLPIPRRVYSYTRLHTGGQP